MPRFLNTWTGEFEWHNDPKLTTYAVLSHVWRDPNNGGEQSYGDVRRIQATVQNSRPSVSDTAPSNKDRRQGGSVFSHPELSDKIKGFCKVARDAGFQLAWNDACCIDKTSSAELSEAINSMYEWYRLSDMCYVYLPDVPDGDRPQDPKSKFRESRWHERGWTLQELIAPERVEFLTQSWRFLGTKMGLATTLEQRTGIDFAILTGRAALDSVSVARRMSWAAERHTTRVEDQAYSLLGIFGIHMSPIYGEGGNAFRRLQEEIVRTIPDQSIFAWGDSFTMRSLATRGHDRFDERSPGLLASSPHPFKDSSDITLVTPSHLATSLRLERSSEDVPTMHCIFTPNGVRMRLLCLPLVGAQHALEAFREVEIGSTCAECRRLGHADTLAFLQCQNRLGHLIALPLCRSREEGGSKHGLYIRTHGQCSDKWHRSYRTVALPKETLVVLLQQVRPAVVEVSLLRYDAHPPIPKSLRSNVVHANLDLWSGYGLRNQLVFDIAPHSIYSLKAQGFVPSPLRVARSDRAIFLTTTLTFNGASRSRRAPPAIELGLSLTEVESWDTKACFSIKGVNVTDLGSDDSLCINPFAPDTARHASTSGLSNVGDHSGGRISVFDRFAHRRRTIVHSEYAVHSDGDWEKDPRGCMVRLLRVALEHPFASPAGRYTSNLLFSIELSEEHRYTSLIESGPDGFLSENDGDGCGDRTSVYEQDNGVPSLPSPRAPAGDGDVRYATEESVEGLRHENNALRAQIAALSSQHALEMQDMDRKMSAMLARLDALTGS
ncbi:Vegetative incompatibility protein HET-E-1 [Trametes pubescens]|uniref:Vegetative incompatibility protein HET-E-1 n=1 Tax=Trametes pubescens TaxID=154538 RepID=A0A1M2V928_TRAPU|nr:Vegetative incompatibility protein HET-E-1 [Trametes pubescens]